MDKWEYLCEKEYVSAACLMGDKLNKYGEQGWELVGFEREVDDRDYGVFYFKRRKAYGTVVTSIKKVTNKR